MRYLTKGREFSLQAGEAIYRTGTSIKSDAIYYVISGQIKLVRTMQDGTAFEYLCNPEDLFGVVSTMAGSPREEDAIAVVNSAVYVWSKDSFESVTSLYIEFARLSIQGLSRYLRAVNVELAKVGRF